MKKEDLEKSLQVLSNNLIVTLGNLTFLEEQKTTIREEIARTQGKLEALTGQETTEEIKP